MPRITRVYTRTGDRGDTGLGGGQRRPKHDLRIETYGTVDELSSAIGLALCAELEPRVAGALSRVQNELFHLGSDLCVLEEDKARFPVPTVRSEHVDALERLMDELSAEIPPLANFVLPGGCEAAARLHLARTICRRAERHLSALAERETVGAHTLPYLNRLSDALFVMARCENVRRGIDEPIWDSRA
jgi:cob(I)alamin adenosyltransferase